MFPAVNQTAHAQSFQPRYQEEAHRWTYLSQKLLFWRQFIFTHDSRDLLFYFQKNIFNNIEENELFLLDIFFLKRVLSWHVSWETIWQVLVLKIIWFFVCTWVIDAVIWTSFVVSLNISSKTIVLKNNHLQYNYFIM